MTERTRTCHECQRPYPIEGIYFRPPPGKNNGFDTVCMACRDSVGQRDYDRLHPVNDDMVKGYPDDVPEIR